MAKLNVVKTMSSHGGKLRDIAAKDLVVTIKNIGKVKKVDNDMLKCICSGIEKGVKSGVKDIQIITAENIVRNSLNVKDEKIKTLSIDDKRTIVSWLTTIVENYTSLTGNIFTSIMKECNKYNTKEVFSALKEMNVVVGTVTEEDLLPNIKNMKDKNSDSYRKVRDKVKVRIESLKKIEGFDTKDIDYEGFIDKATKVSIDSIEKIYKNLFTENRKEILFYNVPNFEGGINLADYAINSIMSNSQKKIS